MRIMILANNDVGLYKFRKELIEKLLEEHQVFICLPYGEYVENLVEMGCNFLPAKKLDRRGMNPFKDISLLKYYIGVLKECNPNVAFNYTAKPNIYGGIACRILGIKYIANITGLGTAVENGGLLQRLLISLYKIGLKKATMVFFQNQKNQDFMLSKNIIKGSYDLLPGSGVNLKEHPFEVYPSKLDSYKFLFIGRIMKDKGIDEYLECAKKIKNKYPCTEFNIVGPYDDDKYENIIKEYQEKGIINYFGEQNNVHEFIKQHGAIIHPSYHEGLSNVLLEAAASGRPVIASNISGCKETFDNGTTGFGFESKNLDSLIEKVTEFIELPYEDKIIMGKRARQKIENEFDRRSVIIKYMNVVNEIK